MEGKPFPRMDRYKYLVSRTTPMNENGHRPAYIISANRAFFSHLNILISLKISINLKIRVYNAIVKLILIYGCETGTLTRILEWRITSVLTNYRTIS